MRNRWLGFAHVNFDAIEISYKSRGNNWIVLVLFLNKSVSRKDVLQYQVCRNFLYQALPQPTAQSTRHAENASSATQNAAGAKTA